MSLSMLFGKSPKVKIICGNCKRYFSKRFNNLECINRNPVAQCPCCKTMNKIPIHY